MFFPDQTQQPRNNPNYKNTNLVLMLILGNPVEGKKPNNMGREELMSG